MVMNGPREGIQHISTAKTVASCFQSWSIDLKTMIPLSLLCTLQRLF